MYYVDFGKGTKKAPHLRLTTLHMLILLLYQHNFISSANRIAKKLAVN